jgi:hypothetical protein
MKLFDYAASIIPADFHATTPVTICATAGMRLLEPALQASIYANLHSTLHADSSFTFRSLRQSDIYTLEGDPEGFYGVVSINSLLGNIQPDLKLLPDRAPVSALDMGGGSTQITLLRSGAGRTLSEGDFFVHSYLGYGADQFRETIMDRLVRAGGGAEQIDNPCAFKNWPTEHDGAKLVGTGDASTCSGLIRSILAESDVDLTDNKIDIDGVSHPPVRGSFYAMSLYFYALDCVRVMAEWRQKKKAEAGLDLSAHPSEFRAAWPRPSPDNILQAAGKFCEMDWKDTLEHIHKDIHSYTRPEGFPHRCFESIYVGTFLKYGYGFAGDSRDITYAFDIDGAEVEWTLGMMLVEQKRAGQKRAAQASRKAEANN